MCSSLLDLGGTHVQQCSECRISRICVPYSRSFKRYSIAASYQHHAGLQPANLVTAQHVLRSRRRSDLLFGSVRIFFTSFFQFIPYSRNSYRYVNFGTLILFRLGCCSILFRLCCCCSSISSDVVQQAVGGAASRRSS